MNERTPPRITRETPIGPDVDLAQEDLRLADGTRLTPKIVEDIVEQVRRATGRPSLSGTATSPQIAFRVAATLRERAAAVAAREGKTISQLAARPWRNGSRTRGDETGRQCEGWPPTTRGGCGRWPLRHQPRGGGVRRAGRRPTELAASSTETTGGRVASPACGRGDPVANWGPSPPGPRR
jgi:hypothetical protein